MRKNIFLIICIFFSISCNIQKDEPTPVPPPKVKLCHLPPPVFRVLIDKGTTLHKDFAPIIEGENHRFRDDIYFYKLDKDVENKYPTNLYYEKEKYLCIEVNLPFDNDIYTGKVETIYLKNATKTYKIEIEGAMLSSKECGPYAYLKEIRIDGQKIDGYFWVK